MEIKYNIGDTVYYANADGTVVAHKLAKIRIEESSNESGFGIAYGADKKGNSREMNSREVFATEEEARDFLLEEARLDYEKKVKAIK